MEDELAVHEVDVVVVEGSTRQQGAVRVEGRAGNRGRSIVVEEARVGLEGG